MSIEMVSIEQHQIAKIRVVGVGGAGGNAVNNMINKGLRGVEFIAVNTDAQALNANLAPTKIAIDQLGAGGSPDRGRESAEKHTELIEDALRGSDMVFVTAGMGGGTGTGAGPVVARIARELGALVVGIITKPFDFEAKMRRNSADAGIMALREHVDSLITIPNQRLMGVIDRHTSLKDAFRIVDDVLYNAARGISDIIGGQGYINVDFEDVRTIMKNTGDALMGTGIARGERRATEAAQAAISSPLLENVSISGAKGLLVNIIGSPDITMYEINEANLKIQEAAGDDVNLIFGCVFDESMDDEVMVTVVATGFEDRKEKNVQSSVTTIAPSVSVAAVSPDTHTHATPVASPSIPVQTLPNAPIVQPLPVVDPQSEVYAQGNVNGFVVRPLPHRTFPERAPNGVNELEQFDVPANQRRNQQQNPQQAPQPNDPRIYTFNNGRKPNDPPAFLRRIMD